MDWTWTWNWISSPQKNVDLIGFLSPFLHAGLEIKNLDWIFGFYATMPVQVLQELFIPRQSRRRRVPAARQAEADALGHQADAGGAEERHHRQHGQRLEARPQQRLQVLHHAVTGVHTYAYAINLSIRG